MTQGLKYKVQTDSYCCTSEPQTTYSKNIIGIPIKETARIQALTKNSHHGQVIFRHSIFCLPCDLRKGCIANHKKVPRHPLACKFTYIQGQQQHLSFLWFNVNIYLPSWVWRISHLKKKDSIIHILYVNLKGWTWQFKPLKRRHLKTLFVTDLHTIEVISSTSRVSVALSWFANIFCVVLLEAKLELEMHSSTVL